jgi:hypothetical protein
MHGLCIVRAMCMGCAWLALGVFMACAGFVHGSWKCMVCAWLMHGMCKDVWSVQCLYSVHVMCNSAWSVLGQRMVCSWYVKGSLMVRESAWWVHGGCMVCEWSVHGLYSVCAWYIHGLCMVCAWDVYTWNVYGYVHYLCDVCLWSVNGIYCMYRRCFVHSLYLVCAVCMVYVLYVHGLYMVSDIFWHTESSRRNRKSKFILKITVLHKIYTREISTSENV